MGWGGGANVKMGWARKRARWTERTCWAGRDKPAGGRAGYAGETDSLGWPSNLAGVSEQGARTG